MEHQNRNLLLNYYKRLFLHGNTPTPPSPPEGGDVLSLVISGNSASLNAQGGDIGSGNIRFPYFVSEVSKVPFIQNPTTAITFPNKGFSSLLKFIHIFKLTATTSPTKGFSSLCKNHILYNVLAKIAIFLKKTASAVETFISKGAHSFLLLFFIPFRRHSLYFERRSGYKTKSQDSQKSQPSQNKNKKPNLKFLFAIIALLIMVILFAASVTFVFAQEGKAPYAMATILTGFGIMLLIQFFVDDQNKENQENDNNKFDTN